MQPSSFSTAPSTRVKATAGQRFVAILIDGFMFAIPQYILMWMGLYSLSQLVSLLSLAYLFTKDSAPFFGGQSVGKKMMGIKVVRQADGSSIVNDWGAGIVRQVSLLIPLVDPILVLIGKERLGDGWAKTEVVKA